MVTQLPVPQADLRDAGLDAVEMLIEYQLPLTSMRADVILAGVHPRTRDPSYAVVELKPWSSAEQVEDSDTLVRVEQYGARGVMHPAIQVSGYCDYMADFTAYLSDRPHALAGVAYLHNATGLTVEDLLSLPPNDRGRIFIGQRRAEFSEYLPERLAPAEGGAAAAASSRARSRRASSSSLSPPMRCSVASSSFCSMSSGTPPST